MKVEVLSPEQLVLETEGEEVIIPTATGIIGVRSDHVPLIVPLKAGEVIVKTGKQQESFAVTSGLVEVLPDIVRILADSAERAQELDEAMIKQAIEEARSQKVHAESPDQLAAATIMIEHNLARLKVAQRRKSRSKNRPELEG